MNDDSTVRYCAHSKPDVVTDADIGVVTSRRQSFQGEDLS
jgi:hypothetical protein